MPYRLVSLVATNLLCIDETEHEGVWPFIGEGIANDAIRLSALVTTQLGAEAAEQQAQTATKNLGDNYQDRTSVALNEEIFSARISSQDQYPAAFNAVLTLGEEDWGGNFDGNVRQIISRISEEAKGAVSTAVTSAVGGAIGTAFGPLGTLIGSGIGAAAGAVISLITDGINSLESDVFPPEDLSIVIAADAPPVTYSGSIIFKDKPNFRSLGGQYQLTYEWHVWSVSSVALKAANGQYMCAENSGGQAVVANRDRIGPWETFELINLAGNKVALKVANGQYVCAENSGGQEVVANRDRIGPWETFELINLAGNKVALKAANGQYVCAENSGGQEVVANRDRIGPWETFELIDL
jgi:Fascin domain